MAKATITLARVKELVSYDPATGLFTWMPGTKRAGMIAGCPDDRGYVALWLDDRKYWAHRVAWLWATGEWPTALIDHRDLNKSNNAFLNLRNSSKSQNGANRKAQANNTSGYKGVQRSRGKWRIQIEKMGKKIRMGPYLSAEEAARAYEVESAAMFGEFARS